MKTNINDYQPFEVEFSLSFIKYLNSFNLLDENLTLCIGWFLTGGQPGLAYPLIDKLSTHQKIEYLKNTLNDQKFADQTDMVKDFNKWFSAATKAKCRRNNYVHGRWRVHPGLEKCVIFESMAYPKNITEYFSPNEFKAIVADMNKIESDFHVLRKKYLEKYSHGRSFS